MRPGRILLCLAFLSLLATSARAESQDHPLPPPRPTEAQLDAVLASPLKEAIDPGLYVDQRWTGFINTDNGYPPDPHGAAGERGVLQISNRRVIYTRKDGETYWSVVRLEDFFDFTPPGAIIDPRAAFDPALDRFYVVGIQTRHPSDPSLAEKRCYIHLAVSKNAHPLTSGSADWWVYKFDVTLEDGTDRYAMDYTGFGFDGQALYVTGNLFTMPVSGSSFFRGCKVVAIDKALASAGSLSWKFAYTPNLESGDLSRAFTLQPATVVGAASPGNLAYFAEVPYFGPSTSLRLWSLSDPLGACALHDTAITVPDWGGGIGTAPQCAPGQPIRTWSPTAQGNAFWRDGSLWFSHTAFAAGRSVIRWYRLATGGFPAGTAALGESGTLDTSPTVYAYQPSIGGNALGDVAIVFTESSSLSCPTLSYSALRAGTGSFTTPVPLTVSPTYAGRPAGFSYTPWGDYASVSEDPIDHGFWITHQRTVDTTPGHWSTEWGQLRFEQNETGWPASGRAVRDGQIETRDVVTLRDGTGGMLAVWNESGEIYAQRLLADGSRPAPWPERGKRVGSNAIVSGSSAASDSAGGAFVVWLELGQAYLTRIDGNGAPAAGWSSNGVELGPAATLPRIVADGAGGALLTWENSGVVAVRVLANGSLPWGAALPLDGGGYAPDLVAGGGGAAIVVWAPGRAQRISSSGSLQWGPTGIEISSELDVPRAAPDGVGGVIAVFQSIGDDGFADLTAVHLDASGASPPGWPAEGVSVCAVQRAQNEQSVVSDGAGGVIVAWRDARSFATSRTDIYAQRVRWNGTIAPGWSANGNPLCTAAGHQLAPAMVADGVGGALVAWQDRRLNPNCATGSCGDDLYAMHVSGAAQLDPAFTVNGSALGVAAGNQVGPSIAATANGAAIVGWLDGRVYSDCQPWCTVGVYARRMTFDATAPTGVAPDGEPTRLAFLAPEPNPVAVGRAVTFPLRIGTAWSGHRLRLDVFDLGGRRVRTVLAGPADPGDRRVLWDLTSDRGGRVRPGFYVARLMVGDQRMQRSIIVR